MYATKLKKKNTNQKNNIVFHQIKLLRKFISPIIIKITHKVIKIFGIFQDFFIDF